MALRAPMTARALVVLGFVLTPTQASNGLDTWIATNAAQGEAVMCKREINGEYFFVARASANRVRLGSRLDLTGYAVTHAYTVSWRLKNEKNAYISADVPPLRIRDEYVRVGGNIYAENVQYQTLNPTKSELLRVEMEIEKCSVRPCSGARGASVQKYTVKICDARL